ncbi:MAG: type II secretion system F family protein [Bacteroidia bacterium]
MSKVDISKYKQFNSTERAPSQEGKPADSVLGFLNKDVELFGNKFDAKRKEWFYSELGILLGAGVDARAALELVEDDAKKGNEKKLMTKLKEEVIAGKQISEVLQHMKEFTSYEYYSIKIGEETGQLNQVLPELSKYFGNQVKLKRQIVGVLTYPLIVIGVSVGVLTFLLTTVVPMFADMFHSAGQELPWATQMIIKLSNFMSSYFLLFFLITVGLIAYLYSQRKKVWYRKYTSALILKVPIFGPLIGKIYTARFCQSMKLLLSSHTRMLDALDLVEKMISFYPMEIALREVKEDVFKGVLLSESLAKHPIFAKRVISLVKVGEEVNQTDVIFDKLSSQLSDEVDHQNAVLGKLIEPFFMLILAGIVGFILIAMYLPMFNMASTIG